MNVTTAIKIDQIYANDNKQTPMSKSPSENKIASKNNFSDIDHEALRNKMKVIESEKMNRMYEEMGKAKNMGMQIGKSESATLDNTELTQEQIDDLVFMYQEEKLARDVYLNLSNIWGIDTFSNIAQSEQNHMDAVENILEKYDVEIPVPNDAIGEFELEELQTLYDNLMEQGSVSATEVLKVGKLIEEVDIADLQERIDGAPEDIEAVYQNLLNGSYNHLDAFNKNLEA